MCNDVNCKGDHQICIINEQNVAVCVDKNKVLGDSKHDSVQERRKTNRPANNQRCNECPNLKMNDIYCASNNRSYTSLCELVKYNCRKSTDYYPLCQDECPCGRKLNLNKKLKLDFAWKYVNNFQQQQPQIDRLHQNGRQIDRRPSGRPTQFKSNKSNDKKRETTACSSRQLNEMGQRLYNWFTVILRNQLTNENERSTKILNKIRAAFHTNCDEEVNFMFMNLDVNKDLKLSLDELYHLEHDQREKCLKIYMDSCDSNGDRVLNNNEWCSCFTQYRPCIKERNNLLSATKSGSNKLSVNYIPNCDETNGFYSPLQCNKFSRYCWCVDRMGNEIANTRKRGKVLCGKYIV